MDKKKVFKIGLIIVIIVLILVLIHIIRNFIIISKISNKQQLFNTSNYSFTVEQMQDENTKNTIAFYHKDNKDMEVIKSNDSVLFVNWYDENSEESISLYVPESKATINDSEYSPVFLTVPDSEFNTYGFFQKIAYSFRVFISYGEVDGEKCYVINEPKDKTTYISKEDGTRRKDSQGFIYKDYTFNKLTDEDLSRPVLDGVEII